MPERNDSQSTLRSNVFAPKGASGETDDGVVDGDIPNMSGPYQAHARPANSPVYTLHCLLGKDGYRSFQYVHLDSDTSFKVGSTGHIIRLRFAGTQVMEVTITGRKLWRLYDYVHQHRMPWIMRADRDLADEHEAIITAIDIVPGESPDA